MKSITKTSLALFIIALVILGSMITRIIRPGPMFAILFMAFMAAAVWLAIYRFLFIGVLQHGQSEGFLPAAPRPPCRAARTTEAIALGIAGVVVLLAAATSPGSGGNMLMLDQLRPEYATANIIMFVCAALGVLFAIVVVLFGRTLAGAIVLAATLICYGIVLNGGRYAGSWFLPKWMAENSSDYTITLSVPDMDGAELWVNGVLLGKTPYATKAAELEAKVPDWPEPPKDNETARSELPTYRPNGKSSSIPRKWLAFDLEGTPHRANGFRKRFYAQVRYAGEWGFDGGWGGLDLKASGRSYVHYTIYLNAIFPQRQKRLDDLLDKARLADYRVAPEWFETLETYGRDGWLAMRKAADREPPMAKLLDDWAAWHYQLDKATGSDSAWQAFLRICDEADARRHYLTESLAGHAVEMLTPRLPQERLIDKAIHLSRETDYFDFSTWTVDGRGGFGYSEQPGGMRLDKSARVTSSSGGGPYGAKRFSVGIFPVAHAVWKLHEQLQARHAPCPNIVQQRITPELIRRQYQSLLQAPLTIAVCFGGPAIDKYLLRQNWRATPEQLPMIEWVWAPGGNINSWLYYLASLNDDAGAKFRRDNKHLILELADRFYWNGTTKWVDSISFITEDAALAKEYWPRLANLARQKSSLEPLQVQWYYLVKIGDAATVDMFAETWRETNFKNLDIDRALNVLDKLDPPKQREVIDALVREIRKNPSKVETLQKMYGSLENVIVKIKAHDQQAERERIFAVLQKGPSNNPGTEAAMLWQYVPQWLAHTEPDSPLLTMLAESDKPDLRLLAMDALREHPTPKNRKLLEKLLKDSDKGVRAAAEKVSGQLKTLSAANPTEFASNPGGEKQ
jgi:hypothetical protein